jgi:hypothetical protein
VDDGVCLLSIAASTSETRSLPSASIFGVGVRFTVIADSVGSNGSCTINGITLSAAGDRARFVVSSASGTKSWISEFGTAGTAQPNAALVADANKDIGAIHSLSATSSIRGPGQQVTAAGSSQSDAAALVEGVNYVVGANGTKGVKLPNISTTVGAAQIVTVVNGTGSNLLVWPAQGQSIESQGSDNSQTVAGSKRAIFCGAGGDGAGGGIGWFELLGA